MPGNGRKDFLETDRAGTPKRPVEERVRDWREVEGHLALPVLRAQAGRCMDCGVPFCHSGCPLGNRIPDWNELVHRDRWREALDELHATNNFPEFTGRTCPAPCEDSCVLALDGDAVTIKQIEKQIIDRGVEEGWVTPQPPAHRTGKRVAVVGSGPAGLAAAQQLARAGHDVVVYEKAERPGGLLRYGIPDFKLEKHHVDRRVAQMEAEGVVFRCGVEVGVDPTPEALRDAHDAVLLAVGAQRPRTMEVPGADLDGVVFAMDYLTGANQAVAGERPAAPIDAAGKHVVILGGGDTGADCLGTAHRQGAASVHHFHYKPPPPGERTEAMPWPFVPMILRDSSSHEEGGERGWSVVTKAFVGDDAGRLRAMRLVHVEWETDADGRRRMVEVPDTEQELPVDLALVAIGFVGPEGESLAGRLGAGLSGRGTVAADAHYRTAAPNVFACGDATRGASLVVWAIWEGREAAREIDLALMGESRLPTNPHRTPLGPAPA